MDLGYSDDIFNRALIYIEDNIISIGESDLKSFGLSQPTRNRHSTLQSKELIERNYVMDVLTKYIEVNVPKMVQDQKEAY